MAFRAALRRIWFELYTNYYGGRTTRWASGFEHVFVGEGKYDPHPGRHERFGEVGGYHSWIKFYLDESRQRVDFRGYNYSLRRGRTPRVPDVVTLQMMWNHSDIEGRVVAQLFKRKGGFFVGPSPACEIIMGAVGFFESQHGLLRRERRRTVIHGHRYDLVVYRNVTPQGSRGDHLRSFYPVFLGVERDVPFERDAPFERDVPEPVVELERPVVTPIERDGKNDGPVCIVAVLANPRGNDRKGEWIELANVTEHEISLDGWELRDRRTRVHHLQGAISPGATLRVVVPHGDHDDFKLTNGGGFISLHDPDGLVAAVHYGKVRPGEVIQLV